MKKMLCILLAGLLLAGCRSGENGTNAGLQQDAENEMMAGAAEKIGRAHV